MNSRQPENALLAHRGTVLLRLDRSAYRAIVWALARISGGLSCRELPILGVWTLSPRFEFNHSFTNSQSVFSEESAHATHPIPLRDLALSAGWPMRSCSAISNVASSVVSAPLRFPRSVQVGNAEAERTQRDGLANGKPSQWGEVGYHFGSRDPSYGILNKKCWTTSHTHGKLGMRCVCHDRQDPPNLNNP